MNPNTDLDNLLRALDPLTEDLDQQNALHRDLVWSAVVAQAEVPPPRRTRHWKLVGASSLATVSAAVALIVGLLPGTAPLSAAATTLHRAATADAAAAALPALSAGQYYYQEAQVTMSCEFAAPTSTGNGPWISYVSEGTMQSWTSSGGSGKIVITPTPVNEGGSHFATAADEATWIAEGKPFVPCALLEPSNQMVGNPANSQTQGSRGGYSTSISGYSGFGVILGFLKSATTVTVNGVPVSLSLASSQSTGSVTSLPTDVQQVSSMLANGEINTDGSVSTVPQTCPVDATANAAVGCDTEQQLSLIQQLLQLPEASAKLGSVLYGVLAEMPGATLTTNSSDSFGNSGSLVSVPFSGVESFQVLLNPTTGALLSSTVPTSSSASHGVATAAPEAAISYGVISVVTDIGALPNTGN